MRDNKPPMTLYLQNEQSLNEEQWRDDDVTWCRDKIFRHDVGPYVHLKQFLEEVERRLELWKTLEIAGESEPITDKHYKQAALMIAKEIMDGEG
jgi:hypothetical protein